MKISYRFKNIQKERQKGQYHHLQTKWENKKKEENLKSSFSS
jgi:hypothetical protein